MNLKTLYKYFPQEKKVLSSSELLKQNTLDVKCEKYCTSKTMKFNSKGELFINFSNEKIYKMNVDLKISELFAGGNEIGYKDGKKEEAQFNYISGMSFDAQDNLYVADTGNNAIRKITPDGIVSTFYKEK